MIYRYIVTAQLFNDSMTFGVEFPDAPDINKIREACELAFTQKGIIVEDRGNFLVLLFSPLTM